MTDTVGTGTAETLRRILRSYRRNCPYGGFIWSLKMKWLSRGPSTPRRILTCTKPGIFWSGSEKRNRGLKSRSCHCHDTNMGLSGINKKAVRPGREAFCFMADEDVPCRQRNRAPAAVAMEKAARLYGLQGRPLILPWLAMLPRPCPHICMSL